MLKSEQEADYLSTYPYESTLQQRECCCVGGCVGAHTVFKI